MLLRAVQRLVRAAPGSAKAAWAALPEWVQRRVRPWVFPIAVGARGGGQRLAVPEVLSPRRVDWIIQEEVWDAAQGKAWLRELERDGSRLLRLHSGVSVVDLARREGVADAVLVRGGAHEDAPDGGLPRLAFRTVRLSDLDTRTALERAFPSVTIVVVAYAERALCEACLRSVFRNTPWPGLEVIAVDNGTRDGTPEMLAGLTREHPSLTVLRNDENLGFARATNQGIRRARGEFVVLLNDDTAVGPGWLSHLVAHLEADPSLGLVCPVTNEIGNAARIAVSYGTFAEMEAFALARANEFSGKRSPLPGVALFCAAARRTTLEAVGFLDERYEVGMFEDDDLSMTLVRRGMTLAVAHDAFVHHVGQASFSRLGDARYLDVWEANRRRFEAKWGVVWQPPPAD